MAVFLDGKMKIFGAVKHLIGEFHTRFAANRKRLQKKPDQKPPCEHNKTGPAPGGAPNPYNRWEQP